MTFAAHRRLRQVRDRNHLTAPRHRPQLLADDLADLSADVGVDLVEDKRRNEG